ncbi:MAG: hypothetical protein SFV15_04375 [Polyangiaceae bacterium]|nr:hypothetical protein [Polyangiaceae bacterium]
MPNLVHAHPPPRFWASSWKLSGLLLIGCGAHLESSASSMPPQDPTETNLASGNPRPPRVVSAALVPRSQDVANAQKGWVTLREPLPRSAAVATIARLCAAIAAESSDDLAALVAPDPWLEVQGERRPLLTTWTARFARLPYQLIPCEEALDLSHISLFSTETPELLGEGRSLAEGAEFVAKVPVLRPQHNGERLFGATLFVGLRRVDDEYRVTAMLDP